MLDRIIESERLTIRPFMDNDLDDLTSLIRDKMASEHAYSDTQWPTDDASMPKILDYFKNDEPWNWCAVELKTIGCVIGFVCSGRAGDDTTRGLGYTIHSEYQNKGYATEACRALMGHCQRALGARRFMSGTADQNEPSVKLLHKLGFVKFKSFEGSFAKDSEGNPITFAAGEYERIV